MAACYLERIGDANVFGGVLVRVRILQCKLGRPVVTGEPGVAILRARLSDWNVVSQGSGSFRASCHLAIGPRP